MNKPFVLGIFITGLTLGVAACHRSHPAQAVAAKPQLSQSDQDFINQAEADEIQERTVAQLVAERSRNKELKKYADTMVADHSAALKELADVTGRFHVKPVPVSSDDQADTVSQFKHLSGRSLDVHFVELMIRDHQKDVGLFQQEARSADENDLREYANTALPSLQSHLKEAEELQVKIDHPPVKHSRKR